MMLPSLQSHLKCITTIAARMVYTSSPAEVPRNMYLPFLLALQLLVIFQGAAEDLEECLLQIVKKYQGKHFLYISDSKSAELEFLMKMKQEHWLHTKVPHVYEIPPPFQVGVVMLLSQNASTIDLVLWSLENIFFENDVLLLIVNLEVAGDDPLEQLRIVWKYNFRNAFVLQHNLKVYGLVPILSGYCADVELTDLGECPDANYQMYDSNVDLSNCTIRIGANLEEPYFDESNGGFEAGILKIVTEKLGLHVEFTISGMDILSPLLQEIKLDLLAGEMMPFNYFPMVAYYSENEMALFVPVAKLLPPWRNIVQIYDLTTWICLLASLVAFAAFWANYNSHILTFYIVCSLISSMPHAPTTFKPLFALWMLFVLILTNAFSGLLISFMFKPLHDKQISSLNDLIAQNWRIYDNTMTPDFLTYENLDILGDRHEWCNSDPLNCFSQLSYDKAAYANTLRNFNYMTSLHGNVEVHKFNTFKIFLVFWSCERSKYEVKIQDVVSRMFEVGLVQHLDTYNYNPPKRLVDNHYKPIGLKHLYLIIGLYFAGLFAALFAFIGELWNLKNLHEK